MTLWHDSSHYLFHITLVITFLIKTIHPRNETKQQSQITIMTYFKKAILATFFSLSLATTGADNTEIEASHQRNLFSSLDCSVGSNHDHYQCICKNPNNKYLPVSTFFFWVHMQTSYILRKHVLITLFRFVKFGVRS